MKHKVKSTFNKLASIYENSIDTDGLYNIEYERPAMMNMISEDLQERKVLDAGCAAGWYTKQLIDRGAEVTATDISPEMVDSAKRRTGDKAEILCIDLDSDLPFEENSFDLIVSSLTLHYIKDWTGVFSEFRRILKPGGEFLFSVHHPLTDLRLLKEPHYFSTELIIDKWKKQGRIHEVPFYRRPLHDIFNMTINYFSIEEVLEPEPTAMLKRISPESYDKLMTAPQFLIVKARR
ncbi:class I SAM-dependent methyltransferase [Bacillus salacetis]|uniref:Class I SAM-dependent methyltransferase n=1 Tax=Bacillus salacetis TaxID=2315464 RepID=A0A3A1R3U7_9BACI|nr:class I SAM-dependent methyltransferase [Bacillus salacetis]RIW37415.1 class I SAM-dependent methyltransferase [Bacillus salacetis]